MPEFFVNYRTGYGEYAATHIEDTLSQRFGSERVFRDAKSIEPGENFQARLNAASAEARALLVLMGAGWATAPNKTFTGPALADENDWVRREILNAKASGARIIPVLCGHHLEPVKGDALPPELRFLGDHQALPFSHRNVVNDLEQIVNTLAEMTPGLPSEDRDPSVSNRNTGAGNIVQTQQAGNTDFGGTTTTSFNAPVETTGLHTGSGDQYIGGPGPARGEAR